jgi:hypothetical protein
LAEIFDGYLFLVAWRRKGEDEKEGKLRRDGFEIVRVERG